MLLAFLQGGVAMLDQAQRTLALSHVLWIGGSPCAGKSSIGHTIARTHVFLKERGKDSPPL